MPLFLWLPGGMSPLFRGVGEEELEGMLQCLNAGVRRFPAGSVIMLAGECAQQVAIMTNMIEYSIKSTGVRIHLTLLENSIFQMMFSADTCIPSII